jgi:hypothetical protein
MHSLFVGIACRVSAMRGRITEMAGAVIVILLAQAGAVAQVPAGWLGTWKLNVAKSTYDPGPAPYKRATYSIEPHEDGMKVTYDMVHPRGGITHLEWKGKLDGRDYPLQGIDEVLTYAYRPAADGSFEVIVKFDGRVTAVSRVTLSADGRTMITTTTGRGARGQDVLTRTVYEKQ